MDTKSKVLFGVFGILIILSVSASYYRYMVLHDYLVQAEVDCDPTYESCFVWECDPEAEECTGNPDENTWYYKFAYRNAKNIPSCVTSDEDCDQFTCPDGGEDQCGEELCSADTLLEYHIDTPCTDPEDFADELIVEKEIKGSADEEQSTEDQVSTSGERVSTEEGEETVGTDDTSTETMTSTDEGL